MRFHFENIGPVASADLDLGDLTLVAGKNNTGKTYIVYALYGFLRMWSDLLPRELRTRSKPFHEMAVEASALLDGPAGSSVSFDRATVERVRRRWLQDVARSFSGRGIAQVFSTVHAEFADSILGVEPPALPIGLSRTVHIGRSEVKAAYGDGRVDVELTASDPRRESGGRVGTRARIGRRPPPFSLLAEVLFPDRIDPFILSAERFGISLFYKELDFTKSRLVELLQQLGDEKERRDDSPYFVVDRAASRYALPVKDNIDFTRNLPSHRGRLGDLGSMKLQDDIKDLIGGYYRVADDEIRFQSKVRNKPFNIPLHLASSSARGLSDMYFYLRHTAAHNQLLVIDEPESHLDTENQIALARTLARLVRSGVKVLVTTHSDYLIKEINNLVMVSQLDSTSPARRRLGYRGDDGLRPDRIRAYVAEDNGLTRCVVDDYGVEMAVFDRTIDRINDAASELTARVGASVRGNERDAR